MAVVREGDSPQMDSDSQSSTSKPAAKRGRKRDDTAPPSRSKLIQRNFRERKAQQLADLHARLSSLEQENRSLKMQAGSLSHGRPNDSNDTVGSIPHSEYASPVPSTSHQPYSSYDPYALPHIRLETSTGHPFHPHNQTDLVSPPPQIHPALLQAALPPHYSSHPPHLPTSDTLHPTSHEVDLLAHHFAPPFPSFQHPKHYSDFCLVLLRALPITHKGLTGLLSLDLDKPDECCAGLVDCSDATRFENGGGARGKFSPAVQVWETVDRALAGLGSGESVAAALVGKPGAVKCEEERGVVLNDEVVFALLRRVRETLAGVC